jgi:hypothetical protein
MIRKPALGADVCRLGNPQEGAVRFWRDSSGRLTFDLPGVAAADYPAVCRGIADALGLAPAGDILIGPDQMCWDFRRGDQVVSLDWDIWMEFMAVAKSEASEPLLRDISAWLSSTAAAELGH